jgi:hypothetical protein
MTATLDGVTTRKQPPEASAEAEAARELVRLARERGLALTGPTRASASASRTVAPVPASPQPTLARVRSAENQFSAA